MAKKLGNFVQDLRLPKGFIREPRFLKMARKYGGNGVYAALLLWDWMAENTPTTGRFEKLEREDILHICSCGTEHTDFIDDLMGNELLGLGEDGVYFLPNWRDDQPHVAKAEERREAGRAAVKKRWDKRNTANNEEGEEKPDTDGNTPVLGANYSNANSNTNLKPPPAPPRGGQTQSVPVSEIVALYREALPELPEPREETEKLTKDIGARWQAKSERHSLEWWAGFSALVRESPYLMGENTGSWCASLGWLVAKGNMDKVLGGEYPTRKQVESTRGSRSGRGATTSQVVHAGRARTDALGGRGCGSRSRSQDRLSPCPQIAGRKLRAG